MILISIHPEYVNGIRNGFKNYEFRKPSFYKEVNINADYFAVYESSPVKEISMIIKSGGLIKKKVRDLWRMCEDCAGIDEGSFFDYYKGKDEGVAIVIDEFIILDEPISLEVLRSEYSIKQPPQNYFMLDTKFKKLNEKLKEFV